MAIEGINDIWLNILRRMQGVKLHGNGGAAIITMRVMVDGDGIPILWLEPRVQRVEPKACNVRDVFEMLSGDSA